MLSPAELQRTRRAPRSLPSLKQQYHTYILERIEAYKNSLTRGGMLELGTEATLELDTSGEDQFVLTEILLSDMVDRLIMKRLGLPSYARWRKQYQGLRVAQREPIHWGLDPSNALLALLPRIEAGDNTLLVGTGVQGEACLLSAYDAEVTFLAEDITVVEQLENRILAESLSSRFMAFVSNLGEWFPPFERPVDLAVVDAGTLARLSYGQRQALLIGLQNLTRPGGIHLLLPGDGTSAPEGYISHYPDWDREPLPPLRRGKAGRSRGVILGRPSCP